MLFIVNRIYNQSNDYNACMFKVEEELGKKLVDKITCLLQTRDRFKQWVLLEEHIMEPNTFDVDEKRVLKFMATYDPLTEAMDSYPEMNGIVDFLASDLSGWMGQFRIHADAQYLYQTEEGFTTYFMVQIIPDE